MKYVCQVENKVTSIFALDEGILIEFTIQHMPSYLDIKDSISFKTQSEAGRTKPPPRKYSYVSLNYHPYNEYRPLLVEGDETGTCWINQDARILHTFRELSLSVCYGSVTQSHSIVLLKPNLREIAENQVTPSFENSIYDLGINNEGFDSAYETSKPYITIQRLFTDNGSEEAASAFELIESQEYYRMNLSMQNNVLLKHFYLYMQVRGEQNYIKVYSIVFTYDHGSPHKFTVSPVKKVRYIEDCLNMWPHKFIHFENSTVEFYRTFADIFKDENVLLQRKDILKSNQNIINEVLETEPRKIDLHSYLNFKSHKHMMVDAEFQDSILVQDSSRNHFRLFLGKECVFEFSLKDESFRHKVVEGETCEVVGVAEGVFRVECTKKDGTRRFMHLDKSIPIIDDSFLVSVLRVFLSVYDSKIYHALVRDLILNCLNFDAMHCTPANMDPDDARCCNFKSSNNEVFVRLTTYFAYLLSVDESTKDSMGEWDDITFSSNLRIPGQISPSEMKRIKSSQDSDTSEEIYTSNNQSWELLQRATFIDKDLQEVSLLFEELDFNDYFKPTINQASPKEKNIRKIMPRVSVTTEMFSQFRVKFFKFLHLLHEDLKLNVMMKENLHKLGFFLYSYSNFLNVGNVSNYIDYYSREHSTLPFDFAANQSLQLIDKIMRKKGKIISLSTFTSSYELEEKLFDLEMLEEEPFDLTKYLSLVMGTKDQKKYPILFNRTFFVLKVFLKHYNGSEDKCFKVFKRSISIQDSLIESALPSVPVHRCYFSMEEAQNLEQRLVNLVSRLSLRSKCGKVNDEIYLFMIDSKFRHSSLESYSASIRTVLESIIREIRINLPAYIFNPCLPKGAYTLINREDIYMNIILYPKVKPIRTSSSYLAPSFMDRNTSYLSEKTSNDNFYSNYSHIKEEKKDHRNEDYTNKRFTSYLEKINNFKFNDNDLVYNEIQRILNISDLIRIKAKYIENSHEDDRYEYEAETQVLLRKFVIRRLSVLVGRGAVTINTDRSLFTEILHIPKINFVAFIESSNRKVSLEKKDENINWPEFHSGVSVGLKIPREILDQKNKDTLRTWIDYQKTSSESYDKPGLIYALGLQGLLYCFLPTDIYLYLKPYFEPRSIGILLGLAASKIGSREENIMKALAVHLACMLPENTDLQLAMTVECAALVSIGLLYKGTCNKQFSQTMLREILARPTKEKNFERESYSLSAGFALGLINLGKGKHLNFKMDSSLDSELLRLVEGGKAPGKPPTNKRCSNIKEGDFINTQLVAPSALMALALIYMKSENQQIANKISIPTFFYEIENCNPNHILLKILTKNLIMWNGVAATDKFITDQIPPLVR